MAQFVIRLKSGAFWIGKNEATGLPVTTGAIDAAQKFTSRWLALAEMSKAGPVMHMGAIVPYLRPSERGNQPDKPTQPSADVAPCGQRPGKTVMPWQRWKWLSEHMWAMHRVTGSEIPKLKSTRTTSLLRRVK